MKCESRSALDCIEEIVIREAEVPGCTPFYGETGKILTQVVLKDVQPGTSTSLITISSMKNLAFHSLLR